MKVKINDSIRAGGGAPLLIIAGPCVIESRELCMYVAKALKRICGELKLPVIFKASFDKANRSWIGSFRGKGLEAGLEVLSAVRRETGLTVTTDIHESFQAQPVADVCDVIQIPAFLCRQTDLILAGARTGKAVNVKKGQFMAPKDMGNIVEKIKTSGNKKVLITERGTTFGYNNLVVDMRGLYHMKEFKQPVIFDATHSVAQPGARGRRSGGDRRMVPVLARAAAAAGVDGIFLEVHPNPEKAKSDASNMLKLSTLPGLLRKLKRIHNLVKRD
jgi:2-dehydro-3-deoxyphosphooctonate aldolase (KDO 8-P synthase)